MSANFLNYVRTLVLAIPALKANAEMVEEKTKIAFEKIIAAIIFVMVLMVFFDFGANIICNVVGFVYPMIATITAIESDDKKDDTYWLTYWVVFGFFGVVEGFIDIVIYIIPFYFPLKLIFLLWCMLPEFRGAEKVYRDLILPQFKKTEDAISEVLDNNKEKKVETVKEQVLGGSAAGGSAADKTKSE